MTTERPHNRTRAARAAMAAAIAGPAFIAVAVATPASAQPGFSFGGYGGAYGANGNVLSGGNMFGTCSKPGNTIRFTGAATDEGDAFTGAYSGSPSTTCGSDNNWQLNGNYNGNIGAFGAYNRGDTDQMTGTAYEVDATNGAEVGSETRSDPITAQ